MPFGNEAVHVDELYPEKRSALMSGGGTLLNIFWFIFFGWWLCLSHILAGITQCISIIGIPVGIANFKIAAIALWPVGRRVVSVELAKQVREANASRQLKTDAFADFSFLMLTVGFFRAFYCTGFEALCL